MDSKRSAERLTRFIKGYSLWYLLCLIVGGYLVDIRLGIVLNITGVALAIYVHRRWHFEVLARPEIERAHRAPREGPRHFVLKEVNAENYFLLTFIGVAIGIPPAAMSYLLKANYGNAVATSYCTLLLTPILGLSIWMLEDERA